MKDSHLVAHHIRLLNGRIFQKLLSQDPEALYRSEQGLGSVTFEKSAHSINEYDELANDYLS